MKLSLIPILLILVAVMFSAQSAYATDPITTTNSFTQIYTNATYTITQIDDIVMNDSGIFVLITGFMIGEDDIRLIKSIDNGTTWDSVLIGKTNFNSNADLSINDDGDLLACWLRFAGSTQTFPQCSVSTDNGDTWTLRTPPSLDPQGQVFNSENSNFVTENNNILLTSKLNTDNAIVLRVSNDFGVTWNDQIQAQCNFDNVPLNCILEGGSNAYREFRNFNSVIDGNNMYQVFAYHIPNCVGVNCFQEIALTKSVDNGTSWSTPKVVSTTDVFGGDGADGRIFINAVDLHVDGNNIVIIYYGEIGTSLLTQSRSTDGGLTFVNTELDDGTECNDTITQSQVGHFKSTVIGNKIIVHCDPDGFGIRQIISNDFGATYGSWNVVNGTEDIFFQWTTGSSSEKFHFDYSDGNNIYDLHYSRSGTKATYISYSQDLGETYNTDLVIGQNGTIPSTYIQGGELHHSLLSVTK